jgi:hypothetical protein
MLLTQHLGSPTLNSDLNKPKPKFNERLVQLDGILNQLEKEKCFNDLDKHISLSEISNAISKIKVGKAPG